MLTVIITATSKKDKTEVIINLFQRFTSLLYSKNTLVLIIQLVKLSISYRSRTE